MAICKETVSQDLARGIGRVVRQDHDRIVVGKPTLAYVNPRLTLPVRRGASRPGSEEAS